MGFNVSGNIGAQLIAIILGVVILFMGVFILATLEPMFDINTCTNTAYSGVPEIELNGTANSSSLQNYSITVAAAGTGYCNLSVFVENVSAGSTGQIDILDNSDASSIGSITTIPATNSTTVFEDISTSTGTFQANYTFQGGAEILNITTTSSMTCCSAWIRDTSVAGQLFDPLVVTTGTAFAVFGLILIIIGLAMGIGSIKNMF